MYSKLTLKYQVVIHQIVSWDSQYNEGGTKYIILLKRPSFDFPGQKHDNRESKYFRHYFPYLSQS